MITSQRLASSVLRVKPVAWGNHVYSTGTPSSLPMMSAILFSKPSFFSFEKGRLAGSAQTRRTLRLTRSERWPSTADAAPASMQRRPRPPRAAPIHAEDVLCALATKAGLLLFFRLLRLLVAIATAELPGGQGAARASLQVNIQVVDEAHHVLVVAEGGHDELGAGGIADASASDDAEKVAVGHRLERVGERGRIGRTQ